MKSNNLLLLVLGILAVFVLGVILQELQSVLLPFLIAVLLSILFEPVIVFLKQKRVPTAVSLVVVLVAMGVVVLLLALVLYSSVGSFVEAMPAYEARLRRLAAGTVADLQSLAGEMGLPAEDFKTGDLFQISMLTAFVSSGLGSFVSFLGNTFLVILFMLFMLAGSGELTAKIRRGFPPMHAERLAGVVRNTSAQVRQYLLTKTLVSLGTGVLTSVVLLILGVDFALIWGFLAFLLNFIPNVGSLVAVALPVIVSLLQFETVLVPVLALGLLFGVQTVMGNVVEPKMMSVSLNLSALLVLVSLIFWGWLWGLWGMVLAVPLTATLKILCENVEPLRPLAVLMSGHIDAHGRPPGRIIVPGQQLHATPDE